MTTRSDGSSDPKTWPVRHATSHGGVVVRNHETGPEVALIRPASTDEKQVWALPKGTPEPGESGEQTALREVREETGLEAEIVQPLRPITYWFVWAPERVRYRKTVHYFLMRHVGGDATPDAAEVAEVRWVPLADAAKEATYPSERKTLKEAAELAASW